MTTTDAVAHPPIVTRDVWLDARRRLLAQEKELTRHLDRVNAQRRRLPMVRIDKTYSFDTPQGKRTLLDLFDGQRQLIVYHFMFDPAWDKGCPGCTGLINAIGDLSMLARRDTTFTLVSRAPLAKLERYRRQQGWTLPWVSSFGSDFNYDFHVTFDASIAPVQPNYESLEEVQRRAADPSLIVEGESQGLSVFFRLDDAVFHTYSTYARGVEGLTDAYSLLDRTPYGRQEDFEDSPPEWPQRPTYG